MYGVVGKIEKEGLVPAVLNQVQGLGGQAVRQVFTLMTIREGYLLNPLPSGRYFPTALVGIEIMTRSPMFTTSHLSLIHI